MPTFVIYAERESGLAGASPSLPALLLFHSLLLSLHSLLLLYRDGCGSGEEGALLIRGARRRKLEYFTGNTLVPTTES